MHQDDKNSGKILEAVPDKKRFKIIDFTKNEEKCVSVMLEALELSQPGQSKHMRILTESLLIDSREEEKLNYYKVNSDGEIESYLFKSN